MPRNRKAGLQAIQASLDFVDQFDAQVEAVVKAQKAPAEFASIAADLSKRFGYDPGLGLALLLDTHLEHLRKTRRANQLPDGRWTP